MYPGAPGEINGVALEGNICKKNENETSIIMENHHTGTLWLIDARPEVNLSIFLPSLDAIYAPKNNPMITIVTDDDVNSKIV
jgi:hypothetical protein